MTIVGERRYRSLASLSDPDDYRPNSQLAVVVDPPTSQGDYVQGISLIFESIAPRDRIPVHRHLSDEVIVIEEGMAEVLVGEEQARVGPGAVVFIPAGKPHGTRNVGDGVVRLHGIFSSPAVTIEYLDRVPAPGTEGQPPQPPASFSLRDLADLP